MLAALQETLRNNQLVGCCSDPGAGSERAAVVSVDNKPVAAPASEGIQATPRARVDDQRVFTVRLRGTMGKLGLDLEYLPERSVIPIRYVKGSAAGDWNAANPDYAIRAGDRIVAVDSVKGHAEAMKDALASRDVAELKVTIVRLASQLDPQDEAFVDAFVNLPCSDPDQSRMQSPRVLTSGSIQAAPQSSTPPDQEALLQEAQSNIAPPWQPVWSKSQSKYYFYNPHTNQSVWVKPTLQEGDQSPRADRFALATPRRGDATPRRGDASTSSHVPATPAATHRSASQSPDVGGGTSDNKAHAPAYGETVPSDKDLQDQPEERSACL